MKAVHRLRNILGILLIACGAHRAIAQFDSLTNIGHASVKIKTADGKIIYVDPYASGDYSDTADILLVTHAHADHNNTSLVKTKATTYTLKYDSAIVAGVYKSITVGRIKIDAVAAYNTDNSNHQKNSCVGYVLEFNGIKLYHAGDTGNIPEMADLAARELAYALLPMDGVFTMTPETATLAAQAIEAKTYIPIHTMTGQNDTVSDAIIARFNVPNKITLKKGKTIALVSNPTTAVQKDPLSPLRFSLEPNYPNPFNPSTTIEFSVPKSTFVTVKVFNLLGEEIATLAAQEFTAGSYKVDWNAKGVASGVYLYRLVAGSFVETRKMLLLR